MTLLQRRRNIALRRDRLQAEPSRDVQPTRESIDRVDRPGSGRASDLRDEQPDRAAAEDDGRSADMPVLGERDRVHRDRKHLRQVHTIIERQLVGQQLRMRLRRRERREFGMPPLTEDSRPGRHARRIRLDDDPRGAVPKDDRVRHRWRAIGEQAQPRIPAAVEVRIRRARTDVRELGARADGASHSDDPDSVADKRRDRVVMAIDDPVLEDAHRPATDLAAGHEVIDLAHARSSDSRMRSRSNAAARGRATGAGPESPAHSRPMSPS